MPVVDIGFDVSRTVHSAIILSKKFKWKRWMADREEKKQISFEPGNYLSGDSEEDRDREGERESLVMSSYLITLL